MLSCYYYIVTVFENTWQRGHCRAERSRHILFRGSGRELGREFLLQDFIEKLSIQLTFFFRAKYCRVQNKHEIRVGAT